MKCERDKSFKCVTSRKLLFYSIIINNRLKWFRNETKAHKKLNFKIILLFLGALY
jgi:hypothetical protein